MSGFEINNGNFVITDGSRVVASTNGTLLQSTTNETTYNVSITFPDVPKTQLYQWQYRIARFPNDLFNVARYASTAVGALPQEWNNTQIVTSVPVGYDFILGRVSLSRTQAPSHTWLGQTIQPSVPMGQEIGVASSTSFIVEMALGLSRSFTIDIVPASNGGSNLIVYMQQSVGPPAGNFGENGSLPFSVPPNSNNDNARQGAINTAVGGNPGLPVYYLGSLFDQSQYGILQLGAAQAYVYRANINGPDQVPYSDPTNYASTYNLSLKIRLGRKS